MYLRSLYAQWVCINKLCLFLCYFVLLVCACMNIMFVIMGWSVIVADRMPNQGQTALFGLDL